MHFLKNPAQRFFQRSGGCDAKIEKRTGGRYGIVMKLLFPLPRDVKVKVASYITSKELLVGSSTINRGMLPTVAPFIEDLKGLRH